MLGVGGGFVIVPALRKVTNLDMHSIVATSLMIIFLISGMSIVMMHCRGLSLSSRHY
ncbi:TSUP family transporter [Acinetobacter baumannii]